MDLPDLTAETPVQVCESQSKACLTLLHAFVWLTHQSIGVTQRIRSIVEPFTAGYITYDVFIAAVYDGCLITQLCPIGDRSRVLYVTVAGKRWSNYWNYPTTTGV